MKTLRPYQENVLNELEKAFQTVSEVVIASAPNSGKTFIATEFIKNHPTEKFLILTHGTTVLKDQWAEALADSGLDFSSSLDSRISYGLPQTIHRKASVQIDYLVVDEAHEFFFADMVQKIKKDFKPKKIILLTGTPSKFIAKGYKTVIVPGIDLINEGYSSDLYVGMVSTKAAINSDDHNAEGDLTPEGTDKLEQTVKADLDELLESMHKVLCETAVFKDKPELRKFLKWAPTLGKLHKTMIACRSVKQANLVQKYFDQKKVKATTSHYENDVSSENINKFKTDETIKVLIVVDRGILGFDMADLVNVVDLTCSKNIERIYQLYARVMRKSDNHTKKYFFKFSTDEHMLLNKFYMNAALNLMFADFISKYNGKNLKGLNVPVMLDKREPKEKPPGEPTDGTTSPPTIPIDPIFKQTVLVGDLLIDIRNKIGQATNEYAYVTFGKIQERLSGEKNHRKIVNITKADIEHRRTIGFWPESIYEGERNG